MNADFQDFGIHHTNKCGASTKSKNTVFHFLSFQTGTFILLKSNFQVNHSLDIKSSFDGMYLTIDGSFSSTISLAFSLSRLNFIRKI